MISLCGWIIYRNGNNARMTINFNFTPTIIATNATALDATSSSEWCRSGCCSNGRHWEETSVHTTDIRPSIASCSISRYCWCRAGRSSGCCPFDSQQFLESVAEFRTEYCVQDWIKGGVKVAEPEEDGYHIVIKLATRTEWHEHGADEKWQPADNKCASNYCQCFSRFTFTFRFHIASFIIDWSCHNGSHWLLLLLSFWLLSLWLWLLLLDGLKLLLLLLWRVAIACFVSHWW